MESKLPTVGLTIFSKISLMASQHQAINLAQGFPNFPIDEKLQHLITELSRQNHHQYAPMQGNILLREAIADTIWDTNKIKVCPEENILITAGATQGIFTSIQALVRPGEEVIILDPCYDCYDVPILLIGAKPVHVSLNKQFKPDWDKIKSAVSAKTTMLIINSPHNPSGVMWDKNDMLILLELMEQHPNLLLLSDEVYEFITFEKTHVSARFNELLRERAIIISSFGKTFHITGWKVGYLTAPKRVLDEIKKVHQYLVFSVNSLAQAVLAAYLPQSNPERLGEFYKIKRDAFRNALEGSKFNLLPCEGTYFQLASFASISEQSDVQFCEELIKNHGVAAIPISVFYADKKDDKLIRFCFAKDSITLQQATLKLCAI